MTEKITATSLRLACCSTGQFEHVLAEYAGRILGVLAYGAAEPELPEETLPCAWVGLPVFGAEAWYEVWVSTQPVTVKRGAQFNISWDGDLLFGSMVLPEGDSGNLEGMAFDAYSAIFDALDREGYPHLLRVWNYFPRINDTSSGLERYREFNIGRHEAFAGKGRVIDEWSVPAACALGTQQGNLVVCFLAAKAPGISIENPRQTNAYYYPRDFGPRSPTFSRGVLVGDALLISGTASIIGSETVHPEDVFRQLDETLDNLQVVIGRARECGFSADDPGSLFLNVYLRRATDYAGVRSRLEAKFGGAAHIVYLQADVCRGDLLVEVEAFWMPGL